MQFKHRLPIAALLSLVIFLPACSQMSDMLSRLPGFGTSDQGAQVVEQEQSLVSSSAARVPFVLKLDREQLLKQELLISGSVEAKSDWPARDIGVRIVGLRDGEIVRDAEADFIERPSGLLRSGERMGFVGSLEAGDLTDYQLELVWGSESTGVKSEASQAHASLDLSSEPGQLIIENLQISKSPGKCIQDQCLLSIKLSGQLHNTGSGSVESATLGVGFVFLEQGQALDLDNAIPQNEELLELKSLNLGPGMRRSFRLVIDRQVPELSEGEYAPIVRIVK